MKSLKIWPFNPNSLICTKNTPN